MALNKVSGDWDLTLLRDLLNEIQLSGEDATLTGFDPKEIEEVATNYRDSESGEDAPVPEPPKEPVSRPGDLYELGPHRLLCRDSREATTWERLLGRELADITWTDPPYGVDLQIRVDRMNPDKGAVTNGEDAFEGDKPEETRPLLAAVFRRADAHLRRGAPIYIAAPHGRMLTVFQEEFLRIDWLLHQTLVWVKNSFVPGRTDYHYQHEAVIYGWKSLDELQRREGHAAAVLLKNAREAGYIVGVMNLQQPINVGDDLPAFVERLRRAREVLLRVDAEAFREATDDVRSAHRQLTYEDLSVALEAATRTPNTDESERTFRDRTARFHTDLAALEAVAGKRGTT